MSRHQHRAKPKFSHYAMTLDEIGQQLGVSRERIRQIETKALLKARLILAKRGYSLEDLLDSERNG